MTDHPTPERAALGHREATTSGTSEAFADLICADAGLLHAEFDAIIAANFPVGGGQRSRLPPRQSRPAVADRPQRPARREPVATAASLGPERTERQRPRAPHPATQPASGKPGNGTANYSLNEEVTTTRTSRLDTSARRPVATIPPTAAARAPGTQIGRNASPAHHGGDQCRIVLLAGPCVRLGRAEPTISDTEVAGNLPCADYTSEAPPTTSKSPDVLRRSLASSPDLLGGVGSGAQHHPAQELGEQAPGFRS
jgi:hypothetical protein